MNLLNLLSRLSLRVADLEAPYTPEPPAIPNLPDLRTPTSGDLGEVNIVGSLINDESGPARHAIVLDLDVPAYLVPSSTPGHSHLYIDVEIEEQDYWDLIHRLADLGVVEQGWYYSGLNKGYTAVRLPWIKKKQSEKEHNNANT